MTKIDIFSGFLGAGKTTLIKKLIQEVYAGQKIVLIENEFGEIGIDGGFLKEAGIQITEMNSGCICCSLVGDFRAALKKVVEQYHPDRILIEPSGVGKLSDVTRAVETIADEEDVKLNSFVTVADVNKVRLYMKNFGEFYNDQVSHASTILLSRTGAASEEKIEKAVAMLREKNPKATIVTTDWNQLTGAQILKAMESEDDFVQALLEQARQTVEEHEHHHHYDENGVCSCGHHHDDDDDDEDEHEHHHHHHDHDDEDECDDPDCSCHHHHDDDDEDEHEHHHHHHHHHGHDADEVFISWGEETHKKFTKAEIEHILQALEDAETYGIILRAKGYVANAEGEKWIHFDYVPGEPDIRDGGAMVTGRICVIGSKLNEEAVAKLFGVEKQ